MAACCHHHTLPRTELNSRIRISEIVSTSAVKPVQLTSSPGRS